MSQDEDQGQDPGQDPQDLRARLAAVLRANRELGSDYEQAAIDQIIEATRRSGGTPAGRAGRTQAPPPPPGAAGPSAGWPSPPGGGSGAGWRSGLPWWPLAALGGLFWMVPALWGAMGGFAALLPVLIVCGLLWRVARRMLWRAGGPWSGPWSGPCSGPLGGPSIGRYRRWGWYW